MHSDGTSNPAGDDAGIPDRRSRRAVFGVEPGRRQTHLGPVARSRSQSDLRFREPFDGHAGKAGALEWSATAKPALHRDHHPQRDELRGCNVRIVPDWFHPDGEEAGRFGRQWYEENRSAILIVPSAVAHMERNIAISGRHPHFESLAVGLKTPIWWDQRLFLPEARQTYRR